MRAPPRHARVAAVGDHARRRGGRRLAVPYAPRHAARELVAMEVQLAVRHHGQHGEALPHRARELVDVQGEERGQRQGAELLRHRARELVQGEAQQCELRELAQLRRQRPAHLVFVERQRVQVGQFPDQRRERAVQVRVPAHLEPRQGRQVEQARRQRAGDVFLEAIHCFVRRRKARVARVVLE